jgi:hypothetical protein
MPSPLLVSFQSKLAQLKSSLIVERADDQYQADDYDRALGFRVLASAHLEGFVESRCTQIAQAGAERFLSGKPTRVGRALVIWHSVHKGARAPIPLTSAECLPDRARVTQAVNAYRDSVKHSHGISGKDLRLLVLPLGLEEAHVDDTLIASLQSLADKRQRAAHVPVGARAMSQPIAEYNDVANLMPQLIQLDDYLQYVLEHGP